MPPKASPTYAGKCACCGHRVGDPGWRNSRTTGRALCDVTAADRERVYPFLSASDNKQCCVCYLRINRTLSSATSTPEPSAGLIVSKKRRMTQTDKEVERLRELHKHSTPAGHTRSFDNLSPNSQRKRVFLRRNPALDLKSDESVIVREHLLLLLMSMVTCGRLVQKLQEGSLDVPAYLSCPSVPFVYSPTSCTPAATLDSCPGDLTLVKKEGMLHVVSPH